MTWLTVMEYLCHKWPQICSTCRKHFRSFPHSRLISGFVTRLTRRVPLVEQELLTLPEHLSSSLVFSGVRVPRSLVLYVCFVDRWFSFCTFSFGHCVVCSSSIYDSDYPFGISKLFIRSHVQHKAISIRGRRIVNPPLIVINGEWWWPNVTGTIVCS